MKLAWFQGFQPCGVLWKKKVGGVKHVRYLRSTGHLDQRLLIGTCMGVHIKHANADRSFYFQMWINVFKSKKNFFLSFFLFSLNFIYLFICFHFFMQSSDKLEQFSRASEWRISSYLYFHQTWPNFALSHRTDCYCRCCSCCCCWCRGRVRSLGRRRKVQQITLWILENTRQFHQTVASSAFEARAKRQPGSHCSEDQIYWIESRVDWERLSSKPELRYRWEETVAIFEVREWLEVVGGRKIWKAEKIIKLIKKKQTSGNSNIK